LNRPPQASQPGASERAQAWQRLRELEDLALNSGLKRLSSEEVLELGRLYRRAASDLSQARSLGLNPGEVALLNGLVGRAYGLIYTPERGGAASVAAFFTRDFPACLRRNFSFLAAAVLISLVGAAIGLGAALVRPETIDVLMGPGQAQNMDQVGRRHQAGEDWLPADARAFASSYIMTNNIKVSFFAFAGGILLGMVTLFVLFYNGIMVGAVGAAAARHHTSYELWGFILPHGVLELPAIFISGAAGLMLGYALVNPGEYSRRTALAMAGREAVVLIFGVVVMLIIAGVIEAFFSPVVMPAVFKYLFAAILFTGEVLYFAAAGRDAVPEGSSDRVNARPPEHLNTAIRPLPPI
jgi:uncharacterized membrane protein SpoIIM required for sporulation